MKKKDKAIISLNHLLCLGTLSMVGITVVAAIILSSASVYADGVVTTTSVTVPASCTFTSGGGSFSDTILGGHISVINGSAITTSCNDPSGYSIYAIGYSNDSYANTDLIGTNTGATIKTDGTNSYWKMMVTAGNNATLDSTTGFDTYREIPDSYTRVAYYANNTTTGTITPSYQISVSASQPADAYVGKVKYVLVNPNNAAAPEVPKTYMQDFTLAQCQAQASSAPKVVYDKRDESDYTVRYINDACWMTQNLRITKSTGLADWTISSTDSNFSTNSTWNIHVSDLTAGNSYTEARSHLADSSTVADAKNNGYTITAEGQGAWYNYCAASAGTVCAQTKTNATEDICPAGWHLPSYNTNPGAFSGMTGTVTLPDGTNAASLFSPVYGGGYSNGTLLYSGMYGGWWSSTAYNTVSQYGLVYDNGSLDTGHNYKSFEFYVRCVRTS